MPHDLDSLRHLARLEPAARLVADEVLTRLETGTPLDAKGLAQALAIAGHVDGVGSIRLAKLCAQRTGSLWTNNREMAWPWLQAWLRSDVEAAWAFVEGALASDADGARALLIQVLGVWDEDLSEQTAYWKASLQRPAVLAKVIPTVFRYLPPRDDLQHEGVYEVAPEDRAVEVRSRLARTLELIDGQEAHGVLKALAANSTIAEAQQFFRDAVRRHGERTAQGTAWAPRQIVDFAAAHERDPATPDELFRLACNRLSDIRGDIETGDFGDRGIFPPKTPELTLQRYFAGRLARESRRRYHVTREEEVADHKEPDIRIRHQKAGVVSIEIKPLDTGRYSVAELMDTLENQLVGQYMRAVGSHHGILLLCMIKNRKWEIERPDGTIDRSGEFSDLLRLLNDAAAALAASRSEVHGLTVIGIDATPWEKGDKPGKAKTPAALPSDARPVSRPRAKAKRAAPAGKG